MRASHLLVVAGFMLLSGCGESPPSGQVDVFLFCAPRMQIEFAQEDELVGFELGDMGYIWLKIKPEGTAREFVRSRTPFHYRNLSEESKAVDPLDRFEWWDVASVSKFRSGQRDYKSASGSRQALRILVDEDDPEEPVVYLMWFSA